MAGMLDGLRQKNDLDDLELCVKVTGTEADHISDIVKDLGTGSIMSIINAVKTMGELQERMNVILIGCERIDNIYEDNQRFVQWMDIFNDSAKMTSTVTENISAKFP